ncbi:hypothetical protein DSM112329_00010 [Paraconexibacter sp. AEG42_29]|uniref:DUF4446 family protein n=1 Tax=Paraconexibacter sp. AEG42_29 TaxID=2997339 RepID=A0AAU7ANJ8_9ACTN
MDDLTSTTGAVALAAAVLALAALIVGVVALVRLRRLRADQSLVLGESGAEDLVGHAAGLGREFRALHGYVEDMAAHLTGRLDVVEDRLDGAIAHTSLVRYDAYNEMSGRQSTTLALLDARKSGIVISTIHHRDTARMYVKRVIDGRGELVLSPEEDEAIRLALSTDRPVTVHFDEDEA